MSVSLPVRRGSRGLPTLQAFAAPALALAMFFVGCINRDQSNRTGSSDRGDEGAPTLDVRGGIADSDVKLGARTAFEGAGGTGGSIRVTTGGGDITMNPSPTTTAPQTPSFAGVGIDVAPGEKRSIAGALEVEWLRVQAGGTLVLLEDTLLVVTGDVEIAGRVDGRGNKHAIDGRDFTVDADGIINITGVIDTSGFEAVPNEVSPIERFDLAGGNGGEIYLSSAEDAGISPGPHIFLTGVVKSDGGDSFSQVTATARPGDGGQILLGTRGSISMAGRISARGGNCYFNSEGARGNGGMIQIVATDDIEIGKVRELNANGGNSSGANGGDGGTVLLEAAVGTLNLDNFDVETQGGRTTFQFDGTGGVGGTSTFTAATVNLSRMTVNASGGDATNADSGEGGPGGTVQLAGTTAITVAPSVILLAEGGRTLVASTSGADGGNIKIVNIDESNLVALDFQGSASVEGGKDAINSGGKDGEVCSSGSNDASNIKLSGTNNFPISICTASDVEDLVVHDLDCDDSTIRPDTVSTALPAIAGVAFYRLYRTAGMVADGVTEVTLTVSGETGGNVNLYVGPAGVLGSTDPTDYTDSSTEPDSDEEIVVDVSGLAAGQFLSVFVDEAFTFVEEYSITAACDA